MRKFHRRVLVALLVLLLAAAVWVPGGFASSGQHAATAHSASPSGSFVLDPTLTEVKNAQGAPPLTIDAAGEIADLDHTGQYGGAGKGGEWKIHYSWTVPSTLVPGKKVTIVLGDTVSNVNPNQPLSDSINVLGPGLAQQLIDSYPNGPTSASYDYTLATDQTAPFTITIGFQSSNVIYHYTPAASTTPPSVAPPPPVVVPTPSGFDQTVTAPEPKPGGTALITSPALALAGGVTAPSAVTVDVSGLSVRDQVIANARNTCYVNFTKSIFAVLKVVTRNQQQLVTLSETFTLDFLVEQAIVSYTPQLAGCLALVDALQQRLYHSTADIAGAACAVTPVALSITGSGAKTRLRSVQLGSANNPHQPLQVRCTPQAGGKLKITVATRSAHTPLSSIVGSRLRIGIVRSQKDSPGGQLGVTFHHP